MTLKCKQDPQDDEDLYLRLTESSTIVRGQ